jgi:hypothetical protein
MMDLKEITNSDWFEVAMFFVFVLIFLLGGSIVLDTIFKFYGVA